MKKIVTAFLLVSFLALGLLPLAVGAAQEGTAVSTAAQFEAMASGGTYYLTADIDLGGKQYNNYIFAEFSGKLDGNGHSVYNYTLVDTDTAVDTGTILRANKIGNLTITDLSFGKEGNPVKMYVSTAVGKSHGVLCGAQENANSMTLTKVNIYADVQVTTPAKCNVGGYIGYSRAFTATDCKMYGSVTVGSGPELVDTLYHNAGGYVGSGNSALTVLVNCENRADITTYCSTVEARAGGFFAYTGTSVQLDNCVNYGNITCYDTASQPSSSQAGGFIGHVNNTASAALLTACESIGKVSGTNWISAFVANNTGNLYFERCVNSAEYTKTAAASGAFVGNNTGTIDVDALSIDKTDPNATTPAVTTTSAPVTTPAPITTNTPTTTATPSTEAPGTDAPSTTAAPSTAAPKNDKGCGGVMASPIFLALIAGAAYGIFKKTKND